MAWWQWGIIVVVVGFLALIIWLGVKEKPKISCNEHEPQPMIVAFGDSLIQGYGASTKGGFVSMVARDLGVPVENQGKSGDTTETGKARVPSAVAKQPDIVIVLLGGNDVLRRVPVSTVEGNLDSILASFKDAGAEVVLLGVMGGLPLKDPYPAMYERLAEKYDAVYVSNVLAGLIGRQEFMSDSIHPNEAGYTRIAERTLPAVEEACGRLDFE